MLRNKHKYDSNNLSINDNNKKRLRRLAWFLDSSIRLPYIDYRIGADGIIGLIPGLGDTVGALLSSYIVLEAAKLGASKSVLLRMALNIAIETIVGIVPIVGDLFDMAWKANLRNVRLLDSYLKSPQRTRRESTIFVAIVLISIVAITVFALWLLIMILRWIWRMIVYV